VEDGVKAKPVKLKVIDSSETVKKVPTSVAKLMALLHRLYMDQAGGSKLRISLVSSC
jgi:hypothetical protein